MMSNASETLVPVYVNRKGYLTHKPGKLVDVAVALGEQYRRDRGLANPDAWGVLNRKSNKLKKVVGSRDQARKDSHKSGWFMPVALFFNNEVHADE